MFQYLRFRWRLWEVDRRRRRESADDEYDETIYTDEISRLHTIHLWGQANRLIVPIPAPGDKTAWEDRTDDLYLTPKGINDLRAAIRAEKKQRREAVLMWVPAISALTGLAGAAIGLVAAWFGGAPAK
jgi:hypothetical protein